MLEEEEILDIDLDKIHGIISNIFLAKPDIIIRFMRCFLFPPLHNYCYYLNFKN